MCGCIGWLKVTKAIGGFAPFLSHPSNQSMQAQDDESQDGVPTTIIMPPNDPEVQGWSKKAKTEVDTDFRNLAPGKGLLFMTNGDVKIVNGPFDCAKICSILDCSFFFKISSGAMIGATNGMFEDRKFAVCSDDMFQKTMNKLATKKLSKQVCGGELYGNILVAETI
jgi:hypothetical protein